MRHRKGAIQTAPCRLGSPFGVISVLDTGFLIPGFQRHEKVADL
ncbi:MAG: hypothetical protein ACEY3L_05430 [Wolbachia sp.]